jgi:hypothetical protein
MRKLCNYSRIVVPIIGVCALFFIAQAADPPETITIGCGSKQADVNFNHAAHWELVPECSTCHHTQTDLTADSDVTVEPCRSCHLEPEDPAAGSCTEMSVSKNPFHKNCLGCHKETVKKDESSAAPTKCQGCHPKG